MPRIHVHDLTFEAWLRAWGAIGAQVAADRFYIDEPFHHVAQELAAFKARQLYATCLNLWDARGDWGL